MENKDIVRKAENVINLLKHPNRMGDLVITLKTNQIRKFLTAVNITANKVSIYRSKYPQNKQLSDELADEIRYLQVKLVYQAGRDKVVKDFIDKAELLTLVKGIGNSIVKFEEFCRYVEALVAYHKYYGGKDA